MSYFRNRQSKLRAAEVEVDIIAFNVVTEDVSEIVDYMIDAITNKSMEDFGVVPEILQ